MSDAVRDALCECDEADARDLAAVVRAVAAPILASAKATEVGSFGGDGYYLTLESTGKALERIATHLEEDGTVPDPA